MTRLSIISDVHLETGNYVEEVMPAIIPDVYICAGDVSKSTGARPLLEKMVQNAPVIYVAGNHEFYNGMYPGTMGLIDRMADDLNSSSVRTGSGHKVWLLNNKTVVLAGIRFIGTTLWTDYDGGNPISMMTAQKCMRDHFVIKRDDGQRFLPEDAYNAFKEATAYIESRLQLPFDGKTVVVTHHSPSFQSCAPEFADDLLNGAFHSNLENLILDYKPALWVHGHTHNAFDYTIGSTRIVCNPHGYLHESRVRTMGYDRNKVVDL